MRRPFDPQLRLDCPGIPDVRLNTECRDEIIPILRALQHIYGRPELRDELLDAVARSDRGRLTSPNKIGPIVGTLHK